MRFGAIFVATLAGMAALAGCAPVDAGKSGADTALSAIMVDRGSVGSGNTIGADFDYRYAFRLPPAKIVEVQDAHVRACDQLGPSRCRVITVRYRVDDNNMVSGVLALQLDPSLATNFGRAASQTVKSSGGLLIDSRVAGADAASGSGRASNVVARLRDEIVKIDTQLRGSPSDDQRQALKDRQSRLRAAIETIGELDQSATQSLATAPILFTYASGTVIPSLGGSTSATFDNAGDTFLQSLASMSQLLAGVGPWLIGLLLAALLLRRVVQPDAAAPGRELGVPLPEAAPSRNVIQRWFGRDDDPAPEPEPAPTN